LAKLAYREDLSWPAVVAWRFVVGAAVAWVLLMPRLGTADLAFSWRQLGALFALGAFYFLNVAAFYAALTLIPASTAVLIAYLYPALVAFLLLRSSRGLRGGEAWAALGLSLVGAALTLGAAPAVTSLAGVVLALVAVLLYSTYLIVADRLLVQFHHAEAGERSAEMTAVILTGTALVSVAVGLSIGDGGLQVAGAAVPSLIALGVVSTAVAVRLLFAGMSRIGAPQAALISTVEPVWTIAIAALLLSETLTVVQLAGGALVIGGVVLSQRHIIRRGPTPPLP
jgi:drug/metabolite transporter (DMT)-like permease